MNRGYNVKYINLLLNIIFYIFRPFELNGGKLHRYCVIVRSPLGSRNWSRSPLFVFAFFFVNHYGFFFFMKYSYQTWICIYKTRIRFARWYALTLKSDFYLRAKNFLCISFYKKTNGRDSNRPIGRAASYAFFDFIVLNLLHSSVFMYLENRELGVY